MEFTALSCKEHNAEFDFGGRLIGPRYAPLIIAEIGINHGGDINLAKKLVTLAAQSGAECVKHQTHFVEDEMLHNYRILF